MKESEERRDIVSGKVMEKENLLRFTLLPDGRVVPDFQKKLPGAGIYVENAQSKLQTALSKNLFAKVCKKNIKTSSELLQMTTQLLAQKGLELISLSRKAGILVTGMEKVKDAVAKGKVAFLLQAVDAGDDGRQKMKSMARDMKIFSLYKVEEIDKALDRVNTVHAAFLKSEMAKTVYNEFMRFEKFLNS